MMNDKYKKRNPLFFPTVRKSFSEKKHKELKQPQDGTNSTTLDRTPVLLPKSSASAGPSRRKEPEGNRKPRVIAAEKKAIR